MAKVKFLNSIVTAIGSFEKGVVREIEDPHTVENWVAQGLVEVVKSTGKGKKDDVE